MKQQRQNIKGTWTHYTPVAGELRRETHTNAWQALEGLKPGYSLCILTKGQFHLADLIRACLDLLGPARVTIATWTASEEQIRMTRQLLEAGAITAIRWMVDHSFSRRRTKSSAGPLLRELFGDERIRSTSCHAKFTVLRGAENSITVRSSMNLNQNPRFEYAEVSYGEDLADFFEAVVDEVWGSQLPGLWAEYKAAKVISEFTDFGRPDVGPASPLGADHRDPGKPGASSWP